MKVQQMYLTFFGIGQTVCVVLLLCLLNTNALAEDAPDKITIPLPDGKELNFRAVYLGLDGRKVFDSRSIKLGSRKSDPSYKERLVETLISGAFVGSRDGHKDWLYYMAETEMQRQQWNAVMRWADEQDGRPPREKDDSNYPQTEVTLAEIHYFIEKLNSWMLTQQRSHLPKYGNAIAFARLPLESEWAFAARGGIKTLENNPDQFDRPYPYEGDLGKFEWYRGNSGNEVQECGSSNIERNPVGLFDMLGNVQELTISLFGPEYQQGRFGQTVVRGGNFSTAPKKLSASLRMEYAPYSHDGNIRRPSKTGFRLILSSAISASGSTPETLDKEFEKYTTTHALTRPGMVGESSPASQSEQDFLVNLKKQVVRLNIDKKTQREEMQKQISRLRTDKKELESRYQEQLTSLKHDNTRLTSNLADLVQEKDQTSGKNRSTLACEVVKKNDEQQTLLFVNEANNLKAQISSLSRQLEEKQQEIGKKNQKLQDLDQRQTLFVDSEEKNTRRVREVEKRYLEALMRQASANAALAYSKLNRRQELIKILNEEQKKRTRREANQVIDDYWPLIKKIAQETEKSLFLEVKEDVSDWYRREGQKGDADYEYLQKSLDLIQRHVNEVRKGHSIKPDNFYREFINQPEFK